MLARLRRISTLGCLKSAYFVAHFAKEQISFLIYNWQVFSPNNHSYNCKELKYEMFSN